MSAVKMISVYFSKNSSESSRVSPLLLTGSVPHLIKPPPVHAIKNFKPFSVSSTLFLECPIIVLWCFQLFPRLCPLVPLSSFPVSLCSGPGYRLALAFIISSVTLSRYTPVLLRGFKMMVLSFLKRSSVDNQRDKSTCSTRLERQPRGGSFQLRYLRGNLTVWSCWWFVSRPDSK